MKKASERILFEDNHLLIVNKLAGELVQGDHTRDTPLLEKVRDYIRHAYNKPGNVFTGLVHRLDRPTSGLVVFAKTSKALGRMNAIFEKREVNKTYWAIVKNTPPAAEGRLEHWLRKDQQKNKSFTVSPDVPGAKKAVLTYKVKGQSESFFLLEILLETGRHHQIRAQLAAIGCPIRGDLKYGYPRSNDDASINLHARSVSFVHPVSKATVSVEAPMLTDKIWKYLTP